MAAISVQGLTKRFGDVLAVDHLTFDVDPGTVTGFLGPSGAGKTTTLRMLPNGPLTLAALILGVLGVEAVVVGMLHRPGLGRRLPEGAATALTAPGDGTLARWAGGLVFAAYGLVLALLGGRLVVRRDLT
jgi:hypothetical protein